MPGADAFELQAQDGVGPVVEQHGGDVEVFPAWVHSAAMV